ncbi:MAG: terminase TerL endonuclease subunit [Acidobacteriaceae bacterium]
MSIAATAAATATNSRRSQKKLPAAGQTSQTYAERSQQYAEDVCAKRILACTEVRQACKRHLDDLKRSRTAEYRWTFDPEKANRFCRFAEAFPHIKDDFLGHASRRERIRLEPWELFIGCSIFGWVNKKKGFRRFTEAFIEVARKNGKTTFAALVLLYCFAADGEFCAEIFAGAASKEQAGEVFLAAKAMTQAATEFREAFGVWVNSASLVIQSQAASFKMLKGQPADGPSPHCVAADEYHEYKTDRLLDWARTGMQARRQPLLFEITTAGSNTASPCYNKHLEAQEVLTGRRDNERLFCIIYTVDKGVDWKSKKALLMANPNFGVSVNPEIIEADQFQATQSAIRQNGFKTKNLNIWVNQRVAWMNMVKWDACADPTLRIEDFRHDDCIEAVDLASRRDTVSTVRLFKREAPDGTEHFYCFSRHYLNEQQIHDPKNTHFLEWASKGYLIETPGDITDYLRVNDDLAKDANELLVREIVFDPLHAAPLIQFLQQREDWNQGVEFVELKQSEENMSAPMKEFEAIVLSGRFHFDGNPLLTWMIGNTIVRPSRRENWYPERENVERKIDGAVAIILGINRWMGSTEQYTRPYVGVA